MCSDGLSCPWGPPWDSPPTQLGKNGVSAERTLGGWGFLERGTLSSETNQKRCECGGPRRRQSGEHRGSERSKKREREVRRAFRAGSSHCSPHSQPLAGGRIQPRAGAGSQRLAGSSCPCPVRNAFGKPETAVVFRSLSLRPQPQTSRPFASFLRVRSWRQPFGFLVVLRSHKPLSGKAVSASLGPRIGAPQLY